MSGTSAGATRTSSTLCFTTTPASCWCCRASGTSARTTACTAPTAWERRLRCCTATATSSRRARSPPSGPFIWPCSSTSWEAAC
uniref:Putative secreted protein n=1 Tax=Ixodes ricinus TaxID=34613 RepID=A0A147BTP1_IXORI